MTLDPHPDNLLGKGILAPEVESDLLAQGYLWAVYIHAPTQVRPALFCSKRTMEDAATDMIVSSVRSLRCKPQELSTAA